MTYAGDGLPGTPGLSLAQTSVQFFLQLHARDVAVAEWQQIRRAYGLAMRLFAGRMHPSGKPYLSHCIGAASVVAQLRLTGDLLAAAILHAAYRWGDFGPWHIRSASKRRHVRRTIGATAEAYVYGFDSLPWNVQAIADLAPRLTAVDAVTRDVVLLRLASELDNVSEHALVYRQDAAPRRANMQRTVPVMAEMAHTLGYPVLAAEFGRVNASLDAADPPVELRWHGTGVMLVPPASSRRRVGAVLGRAIHELVRRARQVGAAARPLRAR